jgi:hypothetical protein
MNMTEAEIDKFIHSKVSVPVRTTNLPPVEENHQYVYRITFETPFGECTLTQSDNDEESLRSYEPILHIKEIKLGDKVWRPHIKDYLFNTYKVLSRERIK